MENTAEPAVTIPGFWKSVLEALKGSHQDYTQGTLGRSLLLLAIPMVLEMIMESVFAVVDVFFVAKRGAAAVATVGLTESLLTLIYTLAVGLSIGASAIVARRVGEKDLEGAGHTAFQVILLAGAFSVLLGIAGFSLAPWLLSLMGAAPDVIEQGSNYTRIMLGGNIVVMLLFVTNAIFRGAGDGAIAMRALWIANGINILLSPSLVSGFGPFPELGVTGAAIGTTIGRGVGALFVLSCLFLSKGRVKVQKRNMRFDPALMLRILKLSGNGMFQVFIGMASWIGLVKILSGFGSQVLAGYTIAIRVVLFALFPSWGLSNAAATLVGQNLGAGQPDRAEKSVWLAGFYNMCCLGIVGLGFVIFASQITGWFTQEPEVHQYATRCLRTVAAGFLFYAYGMVITQSFNGAGDTKTPTLINLFVFWLWEIPLAYVLSYFLNWGPSGVFFSITIAFSTMAVVSAFLFRKGNWKTRRV